MIVFTHRIFLSTPSARRATDNGLIYFQEVAISIHALCEEGDAVQLTGAGGQVDFYPRPLRGGRQLGITDDTDAS